MSYELKSTLTSVASTVASSQLKKAGGKFMASLGGTDDLERDGQEVRLEKLKWVFFRSRCWAASEELLWRT
jgi:hypothetical protein